MTESVHLLLGSGDFRAQFGDLLRVALRTLSCRNVDAASLLFEIDVGNGIGDARRLVRVMRRNGQVKQAAATTLINLNGITKCGGNVIAQTLRVTAEARSEFLVLGQIETVDDRQKHRGTLHKFGLGHDVVIQQGEWKLLAGQGILLVGVYDQGRHCRVGFRQEFDPDGGRHEHRRRDDQGLLPVGP